MLLLLLLPLLQLLQKGHSGEQEAVLKVAKSQGEADARKVSIDQTRQQGEVAEADGRAAQLLRLQGP